MSIQATVRVINVRYSSPGFCVSQILPDAGTAKAHPRLPLVMITDEAVSVGNEYDIEGRVEVNQKHGQQIRVTGMTMKMNVTPSELLKNTLRGIQGIDHVLSQRIVSSMPIEELMEDIETGCKRLQAEVGGIGPKRADEITAAWGTVKVKYDTMLRYRDMGASMPDISKVYDKLRAVMHRKAAVTGDTITDNDVVVELDRALAHSPWDLLYLHAVGFSSVDLLAKAVNPDVPANVQRRLVWAAAAAFYEATKYNGSTMLPESTLMSALNQYLREHGRIFKDMPSNDDLEEAISSALVRVRWGATRDRPVIDRFISQNMYLAEMAAIRLLSSSPAPVFGYLVDYAGVEEAMEGSGVMSSVNFHLSDAQKSAVTNSLNHRVSVITGPPGSGKTAIIRKLCEMIEYAGKTVLLCAPTGKAAVRLAEMTGRKTATIHSTFKIAPGMSFRDVEFDQDVLVVDEASMVDSQLAGFVFSAMSHDTRTKWLVLVGDADQLGPVGAGAPFHFLCSESHHEQYPSVSISRLTDVYRQRPDSAIFDTASSILHMDPYVVTRGDVVVEKTQRNEKSIDTIRRLMRKYPELSWSSPDDPRPIYVAPMRMGTFGVESLNASLRELYRASEDRDVRGTRFFQGEMVMCLKNDTIDGEYICNGDAGMVEQVDPESETLMVRLDRDGILVNLWGYVGHLTQGYALTVHRSQGSQAEYVVVFISEAHRNMLYNTLLYTAMTRASEKLFIVLDGDPMPYLEDRDELLQRAFFLDAYAAYGDPDSIEGQSDAPEILEET